MFYIHNASTKKSKTEEPKTKQMEGDESYCLRKKSRKGNKVILNLMQNQLKQGLYWLPWFAAEFRSKERVSAATVMLPFQWDKILQNKIVDIT